MNQSLIIIIIISQLIHLEEAPEEVRVGEAEEGEGEVRREAAVEHRGANVHQSLE